MSSIAELRDKVMDYINVADSRLLRMMESLAESYQNEDFVQTKAHEEELER